MSEKRVIVLRDHRLKNRAIHAIRSTPLAPVYEVIIRLHRNKRTLAQNNLYWMWMTEISKHVFFSTGKRFSPEDIHEWFKDQFLGKRAVQINGITTIVTRSTTKLKIPEFTEYLQRIEHYARDELDLQLTHPADHYPVAMREAA